MASLIAAAPETGRTERSFLNRALLPFAAGAIAMAAPLINFLHYHRYPMMSAEVALLFLGLAIFAAVMAALYAGQRRWGMIFLEVLLIFMVVDISTESISIPATAALAALAFLLIRKGSLLPFITIMGLVVIATSFAGVSERRPWIETRHVSPSRTTQQPLTVLHIILDEHPGIESLPYHSPAAVLLKEEIKDFYQSRGFHLYGRAYSEHFETVNSIPGILNYGGSAAGKFGLAGGQMVNNEYFKTLSAQGFNIKVFQSSYLDFCKNELVQECTTYWFASLTPVSRSRITSRDKAALILANFLRLSDFLAKNTERYDDYIRNTHPEMAGWTFNLSRHGRASSVVAMQAFDIFIRKLRGAKPGEAYFAHILLPHFPFTFDSECRLLSKSDWRFRQAYGNPRLTHQGHERQLRCVQKKVGEALDAIGKSEAGSSNLIVIIHGDHGSRIVERDPRGSLSPSYDPVDLVRGFSTLFAIRAPQIAPGYDPAAAPVSWLLAEASQSRFKSAPDASKAPRSRRIFIADGDLKVRGTATMPEHW